jgi:mannose-6-phosphate isomerase
MSRVILSGGFDPCHSGHIAMIKDAASHANGGVVICLNSDSWLTRKKGRPFMTFSERKSIMENIKGVIFVVEFDDSDGTACDGILKVREMFPKEKLYFGNGGDRKFNTTPSHEQSLCKDLGIECLWGVGGDYKMNSSSVILSEWAAQTEQRPWGSFTTHLTGKGYKVKTLTINPGQRLSLQKHEHRSETWVVASGKALVELNYETFTVTAEEVVFIPKGSVHRVSCTNTEPCVILELQSGEMCNENDIIRLEDDYARSV